MTLRPIHSVLALISGCSKAQRELRDVDAIFGFGNGCNTVTVKD
jgi:hypothetical protein